MSTAICIVPDAVWRTPEIDGLDVSDDEWQLDVSQYWDFIQAATGISPDGGLSPSDCYRIGNRIQALVEERKRHDEWEPALVESYPDVSSLDEFLWVARFFRACHDCHDAGELCFAGRADDDCCLRSQ